MNLTRRQCPLQIKLALDPFNPMRAINVLDERDLVASCGALAGNDSRVCEEVLPYLRTLEMK